MAINLGETTIKHQGYEYTLRLTTGDLRRLETTVGKSYAVLQELLGRSPSVAQLEAILTRAFLRAEPRPEKDEIAGMLKNIPPIRLLRAATALYSQLLINDEEEDGKDEEEQDEQGQQRDDPLSSETED